MKITITANNDFKGKVIELVPNSFDIMESHQTDLETDYEAFTKIEGNKKTLTWDVDFKKGKTYELSYNYDSPDIKPILFLTR